MIYRMAAYCRLSKDDGENKISESIENQMKLIREYVRKSDDLEIAEVYIDDGYSGLYFENRPEFQRMMEDIRKGDLQGVITKDLSRLGREHIETSNYIERVFPSLGIRYIAILDGVDSVLHRNEELAQWRTLFNDMYSRDISKKIRGALSAKKKLGQFTSGFAPYGYRKDPEDQHHFLVDEEAANVVQKIFYMYLKGYSIDGIAKKLNEEEIMPPAEYKRNVQGLKYSNPKEKGGAKGWAYPTVKMILKNRVYTGAMVQHKSERLSYKIKKSRSVPEEQQYVIDGMHEAIISKEMFEQISQLMGRRTRTTGFHGKIGKVNPYAGILICGDCGYHLQRVTCKDGYECASYHKKGNRFCCSHFIKKETIDAIVKKEIQKQAALVLTERGKEELLQATEKKQKAGWGEGEAERRIEWLRKEWERMINYKKKTYENYMEGILDQEEYLFYQEEYQKREQHLRERIQRAEEQKCLRKEEETVENEMEHLIQCGILPEVTREMVAEWIEKILINGDQSMEIVFKYRSPYQEEQQVM